MTSESRATRNPPRRPALTRPSGMPPGDSLVLLDVEELADGLVAYHAIFAPCSFVGSSGTGP